MLRLRQCGIPYHSFETLLPDEVQRSGRKTPGYWGAVAPLRCVHFCSFPKPWQQAPRGELERAWWVAFATCHLALRRTAPAAFAALLSALPQPASAGADAAQGAGVAGTGVPRDDGAAGGRAAAAGGTEGGGGGLE